MTNLCKLLFVSLFWVVQSNVLLLHGQTPLPVFKNFTTEDGLPSSEVYSVHQDFIGNIWLATDRGITRYDGYGFKTYSYKDGLADITVFKFFEDAKKRLWMLTFSGRIFYFDNDKIYPYKYNEILFSSVQNSIPLNFYVDSMENILLTVGGLGEISVSRSGIKKWNYKFNFSANTNFYLDEISKDVILTSNSQTIPLNGMGTIIHKNNNQIDTIAFRTNTYNRFLCIALSENKLIFAVGKSLFELTNKTARNLMNFPANILFISKDKHNNIWVGTENGIFMLNEHDSFSPNMHYLENFGVTCMLQDHEGGYWFSTLNNGIYYTPGFEIRGIPFNSGVIQKPISITTDHISTVYAGCWNGTIVKIKNGSPKIVYSDNTGKHSPITNLTSFPGDERIFVSNTMPGYLLDEKHHPFKTAKNLGVKSNFVKSSGGNFYCSGTSLLLETKNDSIIQIAAAPQRINCLEIIEKHQLLVGGYKGIFLYNRETKTLIPYRKEIMDIRVDDMKWAGNKLFAATKGKGIIILREDSAIIIDESNGLCSNLVNKLLITGNELWCTTNKGLSRIIFDGLGSSQYHIANINSSDGLYSDEINDITLLNDTIYVTTNYGISFFDMHTDFINHTEPRINFTSLNVNNSEIPVTGELKFRHNQNNIQISFNGISYRSNKKIIYKYQLVTGDDTIHSVTMNREVEFLSLLPGKYTFNVTAMNNSGVWSKAPASISFIIDPSWWQTSWFRFLIIILIASGLYILYRNKLVQLKKRFEMERRQASLQLTAMRAQMNPHFIFNAMNSIRNYMQNHDIQSAEKYLTSFSKLVRYTLDNSEVQEVTLEEELNALRNYTELEIQRFENGFEFNIVCEEGIDLQDTMVLSMLMQPFVENSIKHGISRMKAGGKILIDVRKTNDSVLIGIEDNGIGIEEAISWNEMNREKHISRGTSLIFERISAYNKVYHKNIKTRIINLQNKEGKSVGTRVEIEIS